MNKYLKMRRDANLTGAELAEGMRPYFPRITKTAISFAENPEATGVCYTPSAASLVRHLTGSTIENRSCPYRIQCRLTKADRDEFNSAREIMGHATVNEAAVYAIRWYIHAAWRKQISEGGTI